MRSGEIEKEKENGKKMNIKMARILSPYPLKMARILSPHPLKIARILSPHPLKMARILSSYPLPCNRAVNFMGQGSLIGES